MNILLSRVFRFFSFSGVQSGWSGRSLGYPNHTDAACCKLVYFRVCRWGILDGIYTVSGLCISSNSPHIYQKRGEPQDHSYFHCISLFYCLVYDYLRSFRKSFAYLSLPDWFANYHCLARHACSSESFRSSNMQNRKFCGIILLQNWSSEYDISVNCNWAVTRWQ